MVTIHYGDTPHVLVIDAATTAPATSTSGRYLTAHLPKSENPAKAMVTVEADTAATQTTILYDRAGTGAAVEALITAGASTYPVDLVVNLDGRYGDAKGQTGATVAVEVGA